MTKKSAIDRLDEFGEDRVFGISIKTLIAITITVAGAASGYTMIKQDIEIAKELPVPPVTAEEFKLQTEIIENAIIETQQDIENINSSLKKIDERLYNLSRK
jgi:hypothetical protein|tara:strand:+ start:224 stop:529 length:306 start_codon:yes stop_codon:yes gene_type:complete